MASTSRSWRLETGSRWDGGRWAYDELWGDGGAQGICDLLGVLADAAIAGAYCADGVSEALLAVVPVGARRDGEPSIRGARRRAVGPAGRVSRARRSRVAHGRVDEVGELFHHRMDRGGSRGEGRDWMVREMMTRRRRLTRRNERDGRGVRAVNHEEATQSTARA